MYKQKLKFTLKGTEAHTLTKRKERDKTKQVSNPKNFIHE